MIIIPAIDLLGGKVVRLKQGDYNKVNVYSERPIEVAKRWQSQGARLIHLVDLNGARDGEQKNIKLVEEIIKAIDIEVELGGGIRDFEAIERVFNIGVNKAVLGTATINKKYFSQECLSKYGSDRIIFSIDAWERDVFMEGWGLKSGYTISDLVSEFEAIGLKRIIYTDIAKDGMMNGPNIEGIEELLYSTKLGVIASGGIRDIDDIKHLKSLEDQGLAGVIVGKALYEERLDLAEAIKLGANEG